MYSEISIQNNLKRIILNMSYDRNNVLPETFYPYGNYKYELTICTYYSEIFFGVIKY